MDKFIKTTGRKEDVSLRYLFEFEPLSTSGGLFHFRDQIQKNLKEDGTIFFMNCDVCSLFPLEKLEKVINQKTTFLHFKKQVHKKGGKHSTVLCVNSEMESSKQYGNIFIKNNEESGIVEHYVEKPENCVTSTISCGIYAFSTSIFDVLKVIL